MLIFSHDRKESLNDVLLYKQLFMTGVNGQSRSGISDNPTVPAFTIPLCEGNRRMSTLLMLSLWKPAA